MMKKKVLQNKSETAFNKALQDISAFFEIDQNRGDKVNEAFTKIVSAALQHKPAEEHIKKLIAKYPRTENMLNLRVPKTNNDVWEAMRKGPIIVHGNTQKVQFLIIKGIGILVWIIDDIEYGRATPTEGYLSVLTDAIICLSASSNALP